MAENCEGALPLWGGGAGSPSNTMLLGSIPTSLPSGILIHPAIWPQYMNVTDRTDRQTDRTNNGLIAQGNRFTNGRPKRDAKCTRGVSPLRKSTIFDQKLAISLK